MVYFIKPELLGGFRSLTQLPFFFSRGKKSQWDWILRGCAQPRNSLFIKRYRNRVHSETFFHTIALRLQAVVLWSPVASARSPCHVISSPQPPPELSTLLLSYLQFPLGQIWSGSRHWHLIPAPIRMSIWGFERFFFFLSPRELALVT